MKQLVESSCFWIIVSVFLITYSPLAAMPIAASEPIEFGLKWDANTEAHLDGYEVYCREGDSSSTHKFIGELYADELENPDNPLLVISNLYNGVVDHPEATIKMTELADNSTYYFALTAFDTYGNISEFSFDLDVPGLPDRGVLFSRLDLLLSSIAYESF